MSSDSESGSDSMQEEEQDQSVASDTVLNKYKMAGGIVNDILKELIAKCLPDANVVDICQFGDDRIVELTSKVFRKDKNVKNGIAFPTCISVNNTICHYSPLKSEATLTLKQGDLVKIDFGAHIDGFPCNIAHSLVCGVEKEVDSRLADCIMAAHQCSEAAMRLLKPGKTNFDVTDTFTKLAAEYDCRPVEGMMSHIVRRFDADSSGTQTQAAIVQNPTDEQKKGIEKHEFKTHEVWALDVIISTGDGKLKKQDDRTTVFKRKDEVVYQLKSKTSRAFFAEVDKKSGYFPFTLRAFDERQSRIGVKECVDHGLLDSFDVYCEKIADAFVAQIKFTVAIMPNGPTKLCGTGLPSFPHDKLHSAKKVKDASLIELLAQPIALKSKNKNKKKKQKKAGGAGGDTTTTNTGANGQAK